MPLKADVSKNIRPSCSLNVINSTDPVKPYQSFSQHCGAISIFVFIGGAL
ncbi:MAG TPA: hypothetical protein PKD03_11285 [Ignavibacteriaceae bacterium]|nr:hypothetical protein [Ignavibacteriaceae bacterium]